jgi:hypothetical protein
MSCVEHRPVACARSVASGPLFVQRNAMALGETDWKSMFRTYHG